MTELVNHWGDTPADSDVLAVLSRVDADLSGLLDRNLDVLDPDSRKSALVLIEKIAARRSAVTLRLLAGADEIATQVGNKDASTWLADHTNIDRKVAHAQVRLARDLTHTWTVTGDARAAGAISAEQTGVIVQALNRVQRDPVATPADVILAEKILLHESATKTPDELRALGRRILEVVDPDRFDAAEARALAKEEAAAEAKTWFTSRHNGDGTSEVHARIPTLAAVRLHTCIEAYAQPARQAADRDGKRTPWEQLRGEGLVELIERLDPASLPRHGGDATSLIITITLENLLRDLATATVGYDTDDDTATATADEADAVRPETPSREDSSQAVGPDLQSPTHDSGATGTTSHKTPTRRIGMGSRVKISAGEARRLACNAGILPIVLNGPSQIMDYGRTQRLHPPGIRNAIRVRDKCCRAEGCTFPAEWSQIHHFVEWAKGGKTDIETAGLLCPHHHRVIHNADYGHEILADGRVRFTRRRG